MKLSGLLLTLFFSLSLFAQNNQFTINTNIIVGNNTEFWKAAGSDHLFYHVLKPSGQALLNRMEEHQSHKYMRSHHTFNQDLKHGVIRGQNVYSEDENGNPVYDFSNLNKVFGEYVKRGIKPYVEYDYLPELLDLKKESIITGNDEGMTMRNTGPNDWKKWSDLMKAATRNFIEEFGIDEVRAWYFEVWNEPDGWPVDQLDIFFKMYDVFVDAVTSVDSQLRVGGPACYHEYFLLPFFEHITKGINFVTGEKGTRIDFISYHIYGLSGAWLNNEPHIQPQVQRFSQSVLWLQRFIKKYPKLKQVPFHLNEWGMSSNYYRLVKDYPDLKYRNNHESALFLVKLVNSLYQIEDNYNFPTSVLAYWGFVWEADEDDFFVGKRELTTAGNIPKPIQTGFELLAKLKEQRVEVVRERKDNQFGILATKSETKEFSFIAYNYEEDENDLDKTDQIEITITGLNPNSNYTLIETSINKSNNNTYAAWQKMGSPASSKNIDLSPLLKAANISPTGEYQIKADNKGNANILVGLQRHSMKLIEIK